MPTIDDDIFAALKERAEEWGPVEPVVLVNSVDESTKWDGPFFFEQQTSAPAIIQKTMEDIKVGPPYSYISVLSASSNQTGYVTSRCIPDWATWWVCQQTGRVEEIPEFWRNR